MRVLVTLVFLVLSLEDEGHVCGQHGLAAASRRADDHALA